MTSSLKINCYCRHCRGMFKSVELLINHEDLCPIGKMKSIEHATVGVDTCLFCDRKFKKKKDLYDHPCLKKIEILLMILAKGTCSEWMKGYIMHTLVSYKSNTAIGNGEDHSDLIKAILTAAKPSE